MDLLSYQQEAIDLSRVEPFLMIEHAPRIGMTFAFAEEAVDTASEPGGQNVVYLAPQPEMAAEFIGQCAHIASAKGIASAPIATRVENDDIVLVLEFPSGKTIVASAAKGCSLHGIVATVILDQAAYIPGLEALIDQALPMCVFGGRIILLSRHHKAPGNFFNLLMREALDGNHVSTAMRIPIAQAIAAGLFMRICKLKGDRWSPEAEADWEARLRSLFAASASGELDLAPAGGVRA